MYGLKKTYRLSVGGGRSAEDALVVVGQELGDVLDGEALVLRDGDVSDVFSEDSYKSSWSGADWQGYLRFFLLLQRSLRK